MGLRFIGLFRRPDAREESSRRCLHCTGCCLSLGIMLVNRFGTSTALHAPVLAGRDTGINVIEQAKLICLQKICPLNSSHFDQHLYDGPDKLSSSCSVLIQWSPSYHKEHLNHFHSGDEAQLQQNIVTRYVIDSGVPYSFSVLICIRKALSGLFHLNVNISLVDIDL
jgi:hypothetical protein